MKIIVSVGHLVRHYSLLLPFLLCGIGILQAQEKEIRGTVTADEFPLMNVAVQVQGVNQGTTTNIDGEYRINVHVGDTLTFSHLGYKTRQILITNQSQLDVELEPDATSLGTVEITGGYYSLDERTKTGNVAVVGRDQLDQQVIRAPLEALQGRVAGLEITTRSGMNSQAPLVTLRGETNFRGPAEAQPLYIIDGVPIDNTGLDALSSLYGVIGIDPLATLDPSLIDNIEVLKDADATAIYGSRGANGVIIINTKRGEAGKTKFEMQVETGVSWVRKFMKLMGTEQYLAMRKEAFENDGTEPTLANAPDLLFWDQNKYTDWQKELIGHHANFQKYQGTLSGGNKQTSFLLSGGFQKETTIFPGDFGFQNNNLLANISHRSLDNRLTINSSINYGYQKNKLFDVSAFMPNIAMLAPNAPDLFDKNGKPNWKLDEFGNPTFSNPISSMTTPNVARLQSWQWNGNLSYRLIKDLYIKLNVGINQISQDDKQLIYKSNANPLRAATAKSMTNQRLADRTHLIVEPQVHYNLSFNKSKLSSLIGFSFQKNDRNQKYLRGEGYESESQVGNIALADIKNVVFDEDIKYRYTAIFGRIGYSYNNKYFLNLTGRRDGSSRFGEKNRFGNFGAVGAAWDFYKEDFVVASLPWLSNGKLRGSYGTSGSDHIGDYQYLDTYAQVRVPGGSLSSGGLSPSKLHNPYFQWEKNKKLELAMDMGFWNNRTQISVNWFRERSSNQLIGYSLPSITGFSNVLGNFPATIQNTGWEFVLEVLPIQNANFKWSSTANLTIPQNKLAAFPELESSSYASRYVIGKSLSIRKLYHYTGIDPETGKYTFQDVNEDGILNNDDRIITADLSRKFYGGWNNQFQYKNWGLSFLFEFVKQKGTDPIFAFGTAPGNMSNKPIEVLDRWQAPHSDGHYQRFTAENYDMDYINYISSDAFIVDASFIRLKSLSLNYKIPNPLLKKIGLSQASTYLNTQNLFTWTKYKGYDAQLPQGLEIPALTSVNLGLKLTL